MGELESDSAPHVLRKVNRGGTVDGRKSGQPARLFASFVTFLSNKEKFINPRSGREREFVRRGGACAGFTGGARPSPTMKNEFCARRGVCGELARLLYNKYL